jgi:hypothetical protein
VWSGQHTTTVGMVETEPDDGSGLR